MRNFDSHENDIVFRICKLKFTRVFLAILELQRGLKKLIF